MFIDSAKIRIQAGDGGHGIIAFRREKFVPKGGPAGGDGGGGGDVIIEVNSQLGTLRDIHYNRLYKAKRGGHGAGANKHGKDGVSITIYVPPGTVVKDGETGDVLADLIEAGESVIAAKGGDGGFGNTRFKTSRNRAPYKSTEGHPGEARDIDLELKLLADVGLVGFPNAGKSTLLSTLSAARPKVADYPFTTLEPNLGIVKYGDYKSFVMADIPGLIEGASDGKGLGLQFLRHIERTGLLLYLVDASQPEPPADQLAILRRELENYAAQLMQRPSLVLLTKNDAWAEEAETETLLKDENTLSISSATGSGLTELVAAIVEILERTKREAAEIEANDAS